MFRPQGETLPFLYRRTLAAFCAVEISPALSDHGELQWNVHAHALLLMKPGWPYKNANYIHKDGRLFQNLWREAVGPSLYRSALVELAREPIASLRYVCKSSHNLLGPSYDDPRTMGQLLPAANIIDRFDAVAGLTLHTSHGLLDRRSEHTP